MKYVLNYQPSFQKMESIAALPAKHDFSHYAFIEILNYFTEHKATSLHIEATSKIATTHDYGSIKFAYTLIAFIHNNPSPFQMNLVNDILIKHAYSANHIAKISEYLVQYNPTKLQAYSAIDIAIQHNKSYDPVYFGNILKYFYYIDILYFLTLLKDIFLNDICNAVFEDKSNSHENCLIAGDIVSITAMIPCAMSTPKTSLAHYCAYPLYFYLLEKKIAKNNEHMMSSNKAHTISKILNDMSIPILTCVSSAFLSYYPKLTCLTSATHFIKTIILGEEEEKEILNIKHTNTNSADDTKSDHGQYAQYFAALYGTFVMLAVVKATSSLLKISTIYDKLALANIVYNLFSLSYSLMDSIDQIVYKLAGKSFAACRSKYCIEENDLFINLESYNPDIISKIDSNEFTRIYLQTDNKTLCENYHEAIEEKFHKSEILRQVIHDNL